MASEDQSQTTDSQPNEGELTNEGSDGSSSSLPDSQPAQTGPPPLTIPTSAMKGIKAKAYQKGQVAAVESLTGKLKPLLTLFGAGSLDELEGLDLEEVLAARLEARQQASKPKEPEEKKPVPEKKPTPREDKSHKALLRKQAEANRRAARAERRLQQHRAQSAASEAEQELREEAIRAGVRDVDYALILLKRKLQKDCKTDDDFAAFDTSTFFTELRETKPYLWQAETEPANTGVDTAAEGDGGAPAPSGSGADTSGGNGVGKKNAMEMSDEEYRGLLQELHLNP